MKSNNSSLHQEGLINHQIFKNHLGTSTCKIIPAGISKPCRILGVTYSSVELMLKFLKIVVESFLPQIPKFL